MKRLPAVRERTEDLERASLSSWATLSAESKGRDTFEEPDPLRTAFQRDRDRILNSASFRRLKHKSHLMLGPGHRRTRATHALEVAQIGRTIGRSLRLNEDLIEAIALGHDLGNTAFGGAGEEALSMFTPAPFRHEVQSLRVVESLENGGLGLNLTWEVRDGIVNHRPDNPSPATLEAHAVRVADAIAAVTHDLRDARRAGLVDAGELPTAVTSFLGETDEERQATLIEDVVTESIDQPELAMSPRAEEAQFALLEFMQEQIRRSTTLAEEHNRAVHCLSSLAVYLLQNPPAQPSDERDPVAEVCDVVASYTDQRATEQYRRWFLPS